MSPDVRPFSKKWMFLSMFIFIALELVIGVWVGGIVVGKYKSIYLTFLLQGSLTLVSYFIGGFVVGFLSPGLRISEPAWGAFLSVAIMLVLTFFTPHRFFQFDMTKLLVAGAIAFFLALYGATLGEKASGKKVD